MFEFIARVPEDAIEDALLFRAARSGSADAYRLLARGYDRPVLLSPGERLVLELKHYHGLKLRTVSEVLDTTEEAVHRMLLRAIRKLH